MTLLCPIIEKARIGKTAGSETMGDKLGKMCEKTRIGKTAGSETMGDKLGKMCDSPLS